MHVRRMITRRRALVAMISHPITTAKQIEAAARATS